MGSLKAVLGIYRLKKILFLAPLFVCPCGFISGAVFSEAEGVRRVQAHLLIEDPDSALVEAVGLSEKFPDSRAVAVTLIEALAAAKKEDEAFAAWSRYSARYPDLMADRRLLEELSWGVLKKGLDSSQNGVRFAALIGAFLTKDVRAVPILQKMMRDSNAVIRSVAVQMSCSYGDASLRDEITRMMEEEKAWVVRLEVIKAAGAMKMKNLSSKLQRTIQSDRVTYEERQLAIEALVNIYEQMTFSEFKHLASSDRSGIRHLACSIASHFEIDGAEEEILKLARDTNPDVKIAALNALGLVYRNKIPKEKAKELLEDLQKDPNSVVAITASWASMLMDSSFAAASLEGWLHDSLPENRRLAAAALAAVGKRGVELSLKTLKTSSDPYVKANLSLGLLGQRAEPSLCCDCLVEFLQTEKRMWMWDTRPNPLFKVLAPSQIRYVDHIPNYPEAVDQMTRLNLASLLAILDDPRAGEALKVFLQKRSWGISGFAAATLLQEGDESALAKVKECLTDADPNIRLQASLVLAMMGRDESVFSYLQNAYVDADHERKLHILEALGRVGTAEAFSFLVGLFRDPFPILRVASAAALIQSLNR